MRKEKRFLFAFIICATIALAVHYFLFEMRYMWYVTANVASFMRTIYAVCILTILLLWAIFPSRIAVALVGLFGLFFPHLFFVTDARPLLGRTIDVAGLGVASVPLVLLILATHLCRRLKKERPSKKV